MPRLATFVLLTALTQAATAADPHSYAEPERFLVRHVSLDLAADCESQRLEGTAELTVEQLDPYASELQLDTRDLEIRSVQLIEAGGAARVLAFTLGTRDPILGSRLTRPSA